MECSGLVLGVVGVTTPVNWYVTYNDGHIKGLLSETACPKMYLGKLQRPRTNLTIKWSISDFGIAPGSMGNT